MSEYIQLKNITKIFPPNNVALNEVSIDIRRNEILSIIGENGAGKSTTMKILYGIEEENFGEIYIEGEKVKIKSPNDAVKYKIGMVHQELMLIQDFTVLENILLGEEPTEYGKINFDLAIKNIKELQELVHLNVSLDTKVKNISIAAQQKIEIVKQLYRDIDVLILDEPTAVLTPQETKELFRLLKELRNSGKSIVFISHKLDEVLDVSDRITVMKKGQHIWTKENIGLTKTDLSNAMVGREVIFKLEKEPLERGNKVLSVKNLTSLNTSRSSLEEISFDVFENQIVGIAGIEGNGQYELIRAITSEEEVSGDIEVNGVDISKMSIHEKKKHFSFVPQDRKIVGSSQENSLFENILMGHHYLNDEFTKHKYFLNYRKIKEFAKEILVKYQVNTQDINASMSSLSGGNQQKILLGREFELDTNLLIIDQPVRGLDVGSIEYVHNSILSKRKQGKACLLISADLDELFNLSDIILVMHEGKIVAEKEVDKTNKLEIGNYMLGVFN